MFDSETYEALKFVHSAMQHRGENPSDTSLTAFVKIQLAASEFTLPENFHVHIVGEGQGLPDERPHGLTDREIYFLKLDGSFEYHFLTGKPDGQNMAALSENPKICCNCGIVCCVFEMSSTR